MTTARRTVRRSRVYGFDGDPAARNRQVLEICDDRRYRHERRKRRSLSRDAVEPRDVPLIVW
jgi:hypothetical protein